MKESTGLNQIDVAFLRAARAGNLEKVINFLKDGGDIHTCNANGLNALHLSAKEGHLEVMAELLKRGANVNATTKKGNTALHIGALAGQRGAVEVLLESNAAVNAKAQNGFTPLYMAAQEGHTDVVKVLLNHDGNQQVTTEDGFTPIDVAVQQGHDKVVAILLHSDSKKGYRSLHTAARKDFAKAAKLLLQKGHPADVEAPNGFTPLHIAAKYGNANVANVLIQNGATIDYKTKNYIIAPLHVAAKYGHLNIVTVLVEKGAKVDIPNKDSLTPMHCAARDGHEKVVEYLIQKGASLTSRTKHGLTPLHMSCQGNHVKTSTLLIDSKAPVNAVATNGLTPLHIAAHYGHVDIAELLLEKGADTDARARNGFTPLHVACKKNREAVIQLLLKYNANVHSANEGGQTPMHVATYYGNVTLVLILLQHGGSPDITNVRGETALHIACRRKQITIVRLLLRNGAAVDAKTQDRETPLHIAIRTKNLEMTNLLLDQGASPDSVDKNKCTPLHIAAREGDEEIVATLLEHKANVNLLSKKGFSPLHEAARRGHVNIVQVLLKYYESPDPEGKHGLTPLHVAVHYDHVDVAMILLDNNASPYAKAKNGFTPLHIAAKKNQKEIATALLERGVEPDTATQTGISPLHLAAKEGNIELCQLLMENGASPGITTNNGLTPLHLTARENRIEVAKLLLRFNAPINAQTVSGFTPLHIACVYGHWEIVELLLDEGADIEAATKNGYQPLHLAAQYGHKIIIEILLQRNAPPDALTNEGYSALYIAQTVHHNTTIVDILSRVTQITQTIRITRRPGEEGEGDDQLEITFSAEPEDLEVEEIMDEVEQHENEEETKEEAYDRFMTMEDMVEVSDDPELKTPTQKPGRDSGIFSTRYSGFFQDGTPLTGSRASDLDRSRYSDPNLSTSLQESCEVITAMEGGLVESELPSSLADMQVDNVPFYEPPVTGGFLVSFNVDARGGKMESTQTGIKVVLPPRSCQMPNRITCRLLRLSKPTLLPPIHEGEGLACRVLDVGPTGTQFLQPIYFEVPHFAAIRDGERELVVMKTDDGGWNWDEVSIEDNKDMDGYQDESPDSNLPIKRYTKINTRELPERFAVVSRLKKETFSVGSRGETMQSAVLPTVKVSIPEGAVSSGTKITMQVQPVDESFNNLEEWVTVSPVVTLEPNDITFTKPVTVAIPCPVYSSAANVDMQPSLRLLCCFPKDTTNEPKTPTYQWQDITDTTPLTVVGDSATFTINRPARYWLIETRNPDNVTTDARLIYRKLSAVPYLAKFVVFAKFSADGSEARLRIFCITDDKVDKTLEGQTGFIEVARSRDVEVFEGRPVHIRCLGNLAPVNREPMHLNFFAFRENRLSVVVRPSDANQPMSCRLAFLKEPKKDRQGNIQTICNLNINLSEKDLKRDIGVRKLPDSLLSLVAVEAANDWRDLGQQLGFTDNELQDIADQKADLPHECAEEVLKTWRDYKEPEPDMAKLERALKDINRDDIDFKRLVYSSYSKGPITITETTITRTVPADQGDRRSESPVQRISEYLNSEIVAVQVDDPPDPLDPPVLVDDPPPQQQYSEIRTMNVTESTFEDPPPQQQYSEIRTVNVTESTFEDPPPQQQYSEIRTVNVTESTFEDPPPQQQYSEIRTVNVTESTFEDPPPQQQYSEIRTVNVTESTFEDPPPQQQYSEIRTVNVTESTFEDPPPQQQEVRTVQVTESTDGDTIMRIETTTITKDGETTRTETSHGSDDDQERRIKEMFANEKGVLDFFSAEDEQKPPTDETEI